MNQQTCIVVDYLAFNVVDFSLSDCRRIDTAIPKTHRQPSNTIPAKVFLAVLLSIKVSMVKTSAITIKVIKVVPKVIFDLITKTINVRLHINK